MKNLIFVYLVIPIELFAQQIDSVSSDKLSKWYRNSYQISNENPSIVPDQKKESSKAMQMPQFRQESGAFLYSPYLIPRYSFNQPQILRNTPYYNYTGYMDPTGAGTIGQFLLAGGINYVADKVVTHRDKKIKKKK